MLFLVSGTKSLVCFSSLNIAWLSACFPVYNREKAGFRDSFNFQFSYGLCQHVGRILHVILTFLTRQHVITHTEINVKECVADPILTEYVHSQLPVWGWFSSGSTLSTLM